MLPPLVSLILSLALVGFLLWLIVTYVPMPEPYRRLVVVVVVVLIVLWLLRLLGVFA